MLCRHLTFDCIHLCRALQLQERVAKLLSDKFGAEHPDASQKYGALSPFLSTDPTESQNPDTSLRQRRSNTQEGTWRTNNSATFDGFDHYIEAGEGSPRLGTRLSSSFKHKSPHHYVPVHTVFEESEQSAPLQGGTPPSAAPETTNSEDFIQAVCDYFILSGTRVAHPGL